MGRASRRVGGLPPVAAGEARAKGGFTLIETLVVIAIIGVLAGMVFPVFVRAKTTAHMTTCMNQLRQIGLAMMMYREDYHELAPRLSTLHPDYLPDARVFVCPSDKAEGKHSPNDYLEGPRYLGSGVSYTYIPNWKYARQLGWWGHPPHYGQGKWLDSTPIAMCHWHWAQRWDPTMDSAVWGKGPHGIMLVLAAGGSVSKVRAEVPVAGYSPAGE
jgi:prepilin-type N-terminal cleavage/methylation domain-containing protein